MFLKEGENGKEGLEAKHIEDQQAVEMQV